MFLQVRARTGQNILIQLVRSELRGNARNSSFLRGLRLLCMIKGKFLVDFSDKSDLELVTAKGVDLFLKCA